MGDHKEAAKLPPGAVELATTVATSESGCVVLAQSELGDAKGRVDVVLIPPEAVDTIVAQLLAAKDEALAMMLGAPKSLPTRH